MERRLQQSDCTSYTHETVINQVSKSHFKGKEIEEDKAVPSGLHTWMHKNAYFIHMCTHA